MKVKLTARWGNLKSGETAEVGETLGRWLVGKNRAKAVSSAPRDKMIKSSKTKGIASAR
jgi:hypothetical protein